MNYIRINMLLSVSLCILSLNFCSASQDRSGTEEHDKFFSLRNGASQYRSGEEHDKFFGPRSGASQERSGTEERDKLLSPRSRASQDRSGTEEHDKLLSPRNRASQERSGTEEHDILLSSSGASQDRSGTYEHDKLLNSKSGASQDRPGTEEHDKLLNPRSGNRITTLGEQDKIRVVDIMTTKTSGEQSEQNIQFKTDAEKKWDLFTSEGYSYAIVNDKNEITAISILYGKRGHSHGLKDLLLIHADTEHQALWQYSISPEHPICEMIYEAKKRYLFSVFTAAIGGSDEEQQLVLQKIEKINLEKAKKNNFNGIIKTIVNPRIQKICGKLGYETLAKVKVNKLVLKDGTVPFKTAPKSEQLKVMVKYFKRNRNEENDTTKDIRKDMIVIKNKLNALIVAIFVYLIVVPVLLMKLIITMEKNFQIKI